MADTSTEPDRNSPPEISEGQRLMNRFQSICDDATKIAAELDKLRSDIVGKPAPDQGEVAVRLGRGGKISLFDGLNLMAGELEGTFQLIKKNVNEVRKLF